VSAATPSKISRLNPVERRMTKFLREPPSIRNAAAAVVTVTTVIVVASGILIRILDHKEYPSIWVGMWWALQTVTTVGYGDVTPKNWSGRIVGALVMLEGIAFLAITTAAITSTFVARAENERAAAGLEDDEDREAHLHARFDELADRLGRVESLLRGLEGNQPADPDATTHPGPAS
jgi:voltage-gated potassium channel